MRDQNENFGQVDIVDTITCWVYISLKDTQRCYMYTYHCKCIEQIKAYVYQPCQTVTNKGGQGAPLRKKERWPHPHLCSLVWLCCQQLGVGVWPGRPIPMATASSLPTHQKRKREGNKAGRRATAPLHYSESETTPAAASQLAMAARFL